ncbi:hypothetical protein PI125_g18797 [Phytophthora idaei]|nr:hypothetical protein PI125_g18797 [Phytophthora idaei]
MVALPVRKALLGVARAWCARRSWRTHSSTNCEHGQCRRCVVFVRPAIGDEEANVVIIGVQETKLIAVRLASTWTSAWTSMALLVKQSVLAVPSVVWLMQPLTRRDRVVHQPRGKQAATTPSHTPPITDQDVYVSKLVAFSPDKERWMKAKIYRPIGTAYIIGRVYGLVKKGKNASLFQIRWLDSPFQSAVEHVRVGVVQLGIKNYVALTRVKNPGWRILVRQDPTDEIDSEEDDSDCEEEVLQAFDPSELYPTNLAEVETIKSMHFDPIGEVEGPSYLYQHSDGSTQTYLRPEFKHLFEHSASSSFFAYIPL